MTMREYHPKIILELNLYKLFRKVKSFYFHHLGLIRVTLTNRFDSLILEANLRIGLSKEGKIKKKYKHFV